jgi:hypothetical protein
VVGGSLKRVTVTLRGSLEVVIDLGRSSKEEAKEHEAEITEAIS